MLIPNWIALGNVAVCWMQVVLDLDETLVCAYETSSLPSMLRSQATEAGLKWFELECISSDKVSYLCYCTWMIKQKFYILFLHLLCFSLYLFFCLYFDGVSRNLMENLGSTT